jgi:hypothetical protein
MLRIYSSAPVSLSLACLFQSPPALVRMLPLDALANPVQDELTAVTLTLAGLGQQLDAHEAGQCLLDAGTEQGLRAQCDALLSRQRGLLARVQRSRTL